MEKRNLKQSIIEQTWDIIKQSFIDSLASIIIYTVLAFAVMFYIDYKINQLKKAIYAAPAKTITKVVETKDAAVERLINLKDKYLGDKEE